MPESDADSKRDLATGIAIASLILPLPGTVLAMLQIGEQLDRRRLRARVTALKTRLDASDAEATLELPGARPVDLRRTATDAVVRPAAAGPRRAAVKPSAGARLARVGKAASAYRFSRARCSLRNFATLGAITIWQ